MRKNLSAALAIATIALAGGANSAAAAPKDASTTTLSVIGSLPLNRDGTISAGSLSQVGASVNDPKPQIMDAPLSPKQAAAVRNPYELLTSWSDNVGQTVSMRYGSSTWGYLKLVDKHNLTTNASRTANKYPETRMQESTSAIVYRTPVYEIKCSLGICRPISKVTVLAVVNPSPQSDEYPRGIITTYREGYVGACPDYVKNAVNAN